MHKLNIYQVIKFLGLNQNANYPLFSNIFNSLLNNLNTFHNLQEILLINLKIPTFPTHK